MTNPLYVVILWHMHQPSYWDPVAQMFVLPWVRLHGAKDYVRMADIVAACPDVHVIFNIVPGLAEQIEAYVSGQAEDRLMRLARQSSWNVEDKAHIVNICFSANAKRMIRPYPRYAELFRCRESALQDPDAFSQQDYWDLMAWFNIAWLDPAWQNDDSRIRQLLDRGRDYTPDDIETIHQVQREILSQVLPRYRELQDAGQVELSVSPYHHPILPLLVDNKSTWHTQPEQARPTVPFLAEEDADAHLREARAYYESVFGVAPRGLWPSEGAVSQNTIALTERAGFRWAATDEAILSRSLGRAFGRDGQGFVTRPRDLYQPYHHLVDGELGLSLFFRDRDLSDRVGFLYNDFPAQQAADDIYFRLMGIRERLNDPSSPYVVSIILDGENAWDAYEEQGNGFLRALYSRLASNPDQLRAVTASEYLALSPPQGTLAGLATGSWISGDLSTWIGDPEHARAWDALATTRADLVQWQESTPDSETAIREKAWQSLYVAEGSDWFWWYSSRNQSDQDALFDAIFRARLAETYRLRNAPVPESLQRSIYDLVPTVTERRTAMCYIQPTLTASSDAAPEWTGAAVRKSAGSTGTMQRGQTNINALRVGYDTSNLYLRLECEPVLSESGVRFYFAARPEASGSHQIRLEPMPSLEEGLGYELQVEPRGSAAHLYQAMNDEEWLPIGEVSVAESDSVLELRLPLDMIGLSLGNETAVLATLEKDGRLLERLPEDGFFEVKLQSFDG